MDGWTKQPGAFRLPHVAKVIDDNALGKATPTAPTFYYNAIGDELVTIKPLDKLVAKYCAEGATLQYFRDPAGLEHIQALATFGPLALAYIEARLAGTPAPNSCPPGGKRPPAAAGPQAQPPTSKTCRRRVTLHPRVPGRLAVRRISVRVGGKHMRTLHRRPKNITLTLKGRTRVTVELRITGRRAGKAVTVRDRRRYRVCLA